MAFDDQVYINAFKNASHTVPNLNTLLLKITCKGFALSSVLIFLKLLDHMLYSPSKTPQYAEVLTALCIPAYHQNM